MKKSKLPLVLRNRRIAALLLTASMALTQGASALTIPDSIKVIEDEAFYNTNAYDNLVIPETVEWIGDRAFAGNPNLKDIVVRGTNVSLGLDALGTVSEPKTIHGSKYALLQMYAEAHSYDYQIDVDKLLATARSMLGESYSRHDCVTYVWLCYKSIGIKTEATCRNVQEYTKGTKITSISALQPGDIMCWKNDDVDYCTHVALYVGAGKVDGRSYSSGVFIEASRGARKVRYNYIAPEGSSYYTRNFMFAWRIL